MAKNALTDYSTDPNQNLDIAGISIAEGWLAANVNNALRALLAQIAVYVAGLVSSIKATAAQIWAGTEDGKATTPKGLFDSAAFVSLADASSITLDAVGLNFNLTFTAAVGTTRTLANPTTAFMAGTRSGVIELTQDGSGNKTLTYGSYWKFAGGAPVLSTGANTVDIISYVVRSPTVIRATIARGFI